MSQRNAFFSPQELPKLWSDQGFSLYHDPHRKELYCIQDSAPSRKLATAAFVETKEAEIALLSHLKSDNPMYKKMLFNLLQQYILTHRADLFYAAEIESDFSLSQGVKKCLHNENVMILEHKLALPNVTLPKGFSIIDSKEELLAHLTPISQYLLKNSNWAKKNGKEWLTESLLAKRINESSYTLVLTNENNEYVGYISSISNNAATYIYNFAIDRRYRSQGLGKLLLVKLLEHMPAHEMGYLISAYEGNTMRQAAGLYHKLGFRTYQDNALLASEVRVYDMTRKEPVLTPVKSML